MIDGFKLRYETDTRGNHRVIFFQNVHCNSRIWVRVFVETGGVSPDLNLCVIFEFGVKFLNFIVCFFNIRVINIDTEEGESLIIKPAMETF